MPLYATMPQLMEHRMQDTSKDRQLAPQHGQVWLEPDGAIEYAKLGRMKKLINMIRYLLGDERFRKPFSARKWD
jgi:hypothetical protein